MSGDDLEDFDLGNIPVPPESLATRQIEDAFKYNVAFKLAFVGVGQGGGRIAATFHELGYARTAAVNTTIQDLKELKLPEAQKLDIGDAAGAGKDPATAAAIMGDKGEDLFDLFKRSWGNEVDYAFVCFAAAGGTGAGGCQKVVETAQRYLESLKRPVKVGAIVAIPKDSEGPKYAKNALYTFRKLTQLGLSPVILIDNQKIVELYDPTTNEEHARANQATAQLLHTFNRLAGTDSEHTTFDRADFARLLDSGLVAFGAQNITSWASPDDISKPIREQLKRNILASVDLSKGSVAALVYVLAADAYASIKTKNLDYGQEMLTRMLAPSSTVLLGVYKGGQGGTIKALAMIGGLPWPAARLSELARIAGDRSAIAEEFG